MFRIFASKLGNIAKNNLVVTAQSRQIVTGGTFYCEEKPNSEGNELELKGNQKTAKFNIDRTKIIPVETSIRYLASEAYKTTYGEQPVWVPYRRNHKGLIPPSKTRKTCIRGGVISTGSPCPICRDEFLILDHRNIDLLKQFISPYTGQVMPIFNPTRVSHNSF